MSEQDRDSETRVEPAATPAPRRRRRWPWVLLGVVLVLVGMVAAIPALLSSPQGRKVALDWANESMPGEIRVEEMSLSWLGGQAVRGFSIVGPDGGEVLKLAEFTTELSLLDAVMSRLSLGETVVRGLDADLVFEPDGTSNLDAALGPPREAAAEPAGGLAVPVTGNMKLLDSRITIAAPGIDPISLEDLSGEVAMTGPESPVQVRFSGRSRQGDLEGSIDINGQVSNLFAGGRLDAGSANVDFNAGVEDLPVDALDRLLGSDGVLSAALGNKTSLSVKATGDATRQEVSVTAGSPNAGLSMEGVVADNWFRLKSPLVARISLTPALLEAVNRASAGESDVKLAAAVPVHLTVNQLDVPLDQANASAVAIDAMVDAKDSIRLTGIEQLGEVALNDLRVLISSADLSKAVKVSVDGKPITQGQAGTLTLQADVQGLFDAAGQPQFGKATVQASSTLSGIPTALLDTALQQGGLLTDAVGPTFGVKLNATTDEHRNIDVALNLDSDRIDTGEIQLVVSDEVILSEPAQIRVVLTPELWRRLAGEGYRLEQPSEWILDVESFVAPMPEGEAPAFQPERTRLHANLSSESLRMNDTASGETTRVDNVRLSLAGDTLGDFKVNGTLQMTQPGGTLASLDASPMQATLTGRTGFRPDAKIKDISSSVELASRGLNASLSSTIAQGFTKLALTEPGSFELTVTPALLASWQEGEGPKVTLKQNSRVQGKLDTLSVPLAPFHYEGLAATGEARLAALAIESPGGGSTTIDNVNTTFGFEGKDGATLKLNLDGQVRSSQNESGTLSLAATASNLYDAEGGLSTDAMSLEMNGGLQQLPVALVDQLMGMDGLVVATLGGTANIDLSTRLEKMRGPVSLSLNAPHTRADIKAQLKEEGLTLAEPLVAHVEPTPEFGQKVLSKVHPIFETTQRAEQPVRFEMPAEGVLIPIEDYDFSKVVIPNMSLDLGKVVLKSGWLLRGLVGLGQQFGELEDVQREEWVAWFTPAVLEVKDGRINYARRLDLLLAEKLHLATWGQADVSRDQSNLVLAFMPDTMERVFSITVAENDALHVPIRGPLSSPKVDFKKTAADLARLRAQEELTKKEPLAGVLLGATAGKVTGSGGPIPSASVSPLPWAEQLRAEDEARRAEKEAQEQQAAEQQATQPQQEQPAAQERKESTEEKVIKGLIDLFGNKKE